MPLKLVWLILLFELPVFANAQQYVSPKKVSTGITVAVEIQDSKDLDFIQNNLRNFYGVQRVRVNGDVGISRVAAVLELLDDLQDVQLLRYTGEITDEVLLKLEWVDNVTFYLKNGHEDAILLNNNLSKLNGLTLIFETVPDDYFFIDGLKGLKSLYLIAPFVKKEAAIAVENCLKLTKLRKFGISLDRIDDLPTVAANWPGLLKLTVIDNLSYILEKNTDNLAVLRKNIEFVQNNKIRNVLFEYIAQEAALYPWDVSHLQLVWPASRFAAITNDYGDSSDISGFANYQPLKLPHKPSFDKISSNSLIHSLQDGEYLFSGNTEKDAIFYLGKEAALLIPKGCFKGQMDSVYKGNYAIKCWWLNAPGELFNHALNLNFDSTKRHYELAPDGLLYWSVANDKEALQMREGYFVKLMFRSNADSVNRFYAWDSKSNKWENFYNYDYRFDDTKIVTTDFYSFYGNKATASEIYALDKSSLARRFDYDGYFYLLKPGEQRLSIENYNGFWVAPVYDRAPKAGSYTLKRGKSLIALKKEFVDKKTESGIVKFRIYDKTETLFPELKPFSDYIFEISTSLDPKEFSSTFIRNAIYCDIRIEQVGSNYEIALRTEEGIWRLQIYSAAEKYKNQHGKAKAAHNDFIKRYNKYLSILNQKQSALNTYLDQYQAGSIASARNQLFYPVRNKMTPSAEMKLRNTGVFIWGKPVQQPDTFRLIIKFTDAGGIPFDVKNAWVAHKQPFTYNSFGSSETYNAIINPKELAYIACTDFKGHVYLLSGADFRLRRISNNTFIYLAMNEMPKTLKNYRELEKWLGLGN